MAADLVPVVKADQLLYAHFERPVNIAIAPVEAGMGEAANQIGAKKFSPKRLLPMLDKTARKIDRFIPVTGSSRTPVARPSVLPSARLGMPTRGGEVSRQAIDA